MRPVVGYGRPSKLMGQPPTPDAMARGLRKERPPPPGSLREPRSACTPRPATAVRPVTSRPRSQRQRRRRHLCRRFASGLRNLLPLPGDRLPGSSRQLKKWRGEWQVSGAMLVQRVAGGGCLSPEPAPQGLGDQAVGGRAARCGRAGRVWLAASFCRINARRREGTGRRSLSGHSACLLRVWCVCLLLYQKA